MVCGEAGGTETNGGEKNRRIEQDGERGSRAKALKIRIFYWREKMHRVGNRQRGSGSWIFIIYHSLGFPRKNVLVRDRIRVHVTMLLLLYYR